MVTGSPEYNVFVGTDSKEWGWSRRGCWEGSHEGEKLGLPQSSVESPRSRVREGGQVPESVLIHPGDDTRNLQFRTGKRVKTTYLIPRLPWPVGF